MPDSLEQLDLLLLTVARERRVQADGIRFQGLRYLDPTFAAYVGESVPLRYDPRDMAEIRVFQLRKFLCRAIGPDWRAKRFPCATSYGRAASAAATCARPSAPV